jgi:putative addiction module killer protein
MRPPLSHFGLTSSSFKATKTPVTLLRYQRDDGWEPFTDWLNGLRDKEGAARIRVRLQRLCAGKFGDCKPVGGGVSELRLTIGPGYRVYFGQHGDELVLLLCGGDEGTQAADIVRAKEYWTEWKQMQR